MRETVEKLHPTILSAEDVLVVAERAVPFVSKQFVGDAGVDEMLGDVSTGIDMLQVTLNRNGSNELTPQLKKKNKIRQRALISLRHLVVSWMYRDDKPQKAEAARKIHLLMKRVGLDAKGLNYSSGSVRLSLFIEKLELPENKEALAKFDGQSLAENIKNANDAFEATYRERAENEAETDRVRKDEAKGTALHFLDVLFTHIGYQKEKNGGTYDSLVETLNEVISDITAVARARKTRGENGKPEQNNTPEVEVSAE